MTNEIAVEIVNNMIVLKTNGVNRKKSMTNISFRKIGLSYSEVLINTYPDINLAISQILQVEKCILSNLEEKKIDRNLITIIEETQNEINVTNIYNSLGKSKWNWQMPCKQIKNVPYLPLINNMELKSEHFNMSLPFLDVPDIEKEEMGSLEELKALQPADSDKLTKNCYLCSETNYLYDNILKLRKRRGWQQTWQQEMKEQEEKQIASSNIQEQLKSSTLTAAKSVQLTNRNSSGVKELHDEVKSFPHGLMKPTTTKSPISNQKFVKNRNMYSADTKSLPTIVYAAWCGAFAHIEF